MARSHTTLDHRYSRVAFLARLAITAEARPANSLVEEHVGVGGQHLVQAGLPYRVVRHPEPLRADGRGAAWWRGAAAVRDEMSRVHVPKVNQHSHELKQVLRRAGGEDAGIRKNESD